MDQYFYEVFENSKRQGPGSKQDTLKAYAYQNDLPERPLLLDIGCGKGVQTIDLACSTKAIITATDINTNLLDGLRKSAEQAKVNIDIVQADMNSLPFSDNSFDVLWSEGAVFIIGIQEAFKKFTPFLKPGGYFVFSDCIWLKQDNIPDELSEYWNNIWDNEFPGMLNRKGIRKLGTESGYIFVDSFTIPISSWIDEFYSHIENSIRAVEPKYAGNQQANDTFASIRKEIEIFNKYNDFYGYEFFVFKKM